MALVGSEMKAEMVDTTVIYTYIYRFTLLGTNLRYENLDSLTQIGGELRELFTKGVIMGTL